MGDRNRQADHPDRGVPPDPPGDAAPDLDALRRRVADVLGHPGALITWSWSRYRKDHPTHLAVRNSRVILEASGEEAWWGDLDLTRRAQALSAAARAAGVALLLAFEYAPLSDSVETRVRWGGPDVVARVGPDGRIEVDPRRGYRRGDRLYRQTPAGYVRWGRRYRRADPALLAPGERVRLLRRLAGAAPDVLPALVADARLALGIGVQGDELVLSIPALEVQGHGRDAGEALTDLHEALHGAAWRCGAGPSSNYVEQE